MPREREKKKGASEKPAHTKAVIWGSYFVLAGFAAIILVLLIEELVKPSYHLAAPAVIFLKLLEHLGIAAIVLGLVGIILEFRDWQEYFQKRLAEIVIDKKYLNTLEKEKLLDLQTDTLKAYFKDEEIDRKDSFLEFFRTKIQDFIGSAYKEGTRHVISVDISPDDENLYVVNATLSGKNRKVRDSIPDRVEWSTFKETQIKLQEFSVTVKIPRNFYQSPEFEAPYPDMESGQKVYETHFEGGRLVPKDPDLKPVKEGQGFILFLNDYKDIDGLYVETHLKYTLPTDTPFGWFATHSHKGLNLVITCPPHLEVDVSVFGIAETDYNEEYRKDLYVFEYDSWLLPYSGYSFHLKETARNPTN